jgi:hypothetical protein
LNTALKSFVADQVQAGKSAPGKTLGKILPREPDNVCYYNEGYPGLQGAFGMEWNIGYIVIVYWGYQPTRGVNRGPGMKP